jgi:hypothetical protein
MKNQESSGARIAYITIMNRTAKGITAIEFIGQGDLIGFALTEKGRDDKWQTGKELLKG